MKQWLKKFVQDERGMETVEWAVVAALLVAGLVIAFSNLGDTVEGEIVQLNTDISGT